MAESNNREFARLRKESERQQTTIAALNDTIAKLTAAIAELQEQLKQALDGNTELRTLLSELQVKLDKLLQQKKKRDRKDHGPTTERHNPKPATGGETAEELSPNPRTQPAKRNHKKHIHSQNIPNRPVPHKVAEKDLLCPTCQVETVFVKNEITYQLEKILHSLERLEHQQEVRACPKCKQHVVTAEKPCPPIPGGLPGPCLLASTIVEKCDDGLPQYRQSKIAKREDATLPRSTLCDWFQDGSLVLELLYERLKREVLASQVVQTDDCPVKIQNRKAQGAMRKGKMTVYRGDADHPAVVFDFSPDLSFKRNNDFLKDFSGFVQADAAAGFDALFKDGTKTEVGCSAHSRRKYFELCDQVIGIYGKIYDIERKIKDKPAPYRLAIRRKKSKPLTRQLHRTLTELRGTLHPTHALMEAIEYTLRHWVALNRFLGNPNLEIDNNPAERAIKDFVIARKNFLFVGSNAGGKAMAINLSFIASCKRNDINPVIYLADVFTRINTMKTSELDQLLPHRWAKNRKDHQNQTLSQPP
ncbi:MAG: IS66 family transposase [Terriglobia bacterium]